MSTQSPALNEVKRCTQKMGVKHLRQVQDDLWKARAATAPKSLVRVLLTPVILDAVRKELRRQTGHNADEKEIERILQAEVLRSDLLA
ncbi:hypothetical protein [Microbispora sp. H10949]|uniref:hypothetical protein n=1 Tax=Microbispora sp. H10949 TaxID=2729111 RepID=UPI001601ECF9|nr:hypothetical protein [Microbispora sp. H10949]